MRDADISNLGRGGHGGRSGATQEDDEDEEEGRGGQRVQVLSSFIEIVESSANNIMLQCAQQ